MRREGLDVETIAKFLKIPEKDVSAILDGKAPT
jgi:plasmid maintenance system antidote protein VapI